jgi:hypothetical protein
MTSPRAAFLPLYDPPGSLLDIGIHPLYRNSPALPAGYLTCQISCMASCVILSYWGPKAKIETKAEAFFSCNLQDSVSNDG